MKVILLSLESSKLSEQHIGDRGWASHCQSSSVGGGMRVNQHKNNPFHPASIVLASVLSGGSSGACLLSTTQVSRISCLSLAGL